MFIMYIPLMNEYFTTKWNPYPASNCTVKVISFVKIKHKQTWLGKLITMSKGFIYITGMEIKSRFVYLLVCWHWRFHLSIHQSFPRNPWVVKWSDPDWFIKAINERWMKNGIFTIYWISNLCLISSKLFRWFFVNDFK